MNKRLLKPIYFMKAEELDGDGDGNLDGSGDGAGGGGGTGDGDSAWADTWREDYAQGDESKLARISRYASPAAAFDAMISAQNKISSGEYKSTEPFPVDGSDEEKTAWRTNNGIPETPDKYDLTFDDGLVVGEDDKPIIDDFVEFAHQGNMSPDHVKTAVQWYYHNQEKQKEARMEADDEARISVEDELRAEWGNEYRANINRISGLLDTAPEGVKDNLMNARFADGTPIMSDANTLRFLVDSSLAINPATTLVPGAGNDINGAISDEIAELEGMMGNKNSEYWTGPKADKLQARYRDLITAREKMKSKS